MRRAPGTILITGASSGLGAGLALAYAKEGVQLILLGRNAARLEEVAVQCRLCNALVITRTIDVRNRQALAAFITQMDAATPIDLVIANAGISSGFSNGVAENYARADEVFAVNLQGVLNTIHPLIPRMIARGQGHLAIISSLAGIRALPSAPAYSASKAAVRMYGDALRGELKPYGIQVSIVCPGWIETPLTEKNDFPMPLLMPLEPAVKRIRRGLDAKKARIAFPRSLYYPLCILAALPNWMTDFFFRQMPIKRLKS